MNGLMIRRLIYAFKRQWGREISYVQIRSSTVNDSTGERDIKRDVFELPAVQLPESVMRKFIQDIGYLAANKNFTYGALNDMNKITFIFAKDDMPEAFQRDLNGYITHNGKRYERLSIEDLFGEGYIMVCQGVEGANPYSVINVHVESRLQMQGRVVGELN